MKYFFVFSLICCSGVLFSQLLLQKQIYDTIGSPADSTYIVQITNILSGQLVTKKKILHSKEGFIEEIWTQYYFEQDTLFWYHVYDEHGSPRYVEAFATNDELNGKKIIIECDIEYNESGDLISNICTSDDGQMESRIARSRLSNAKFQKYIYYNELDNVDHYIITDMENEMELELDSNKVLNFINAPIYFKELKDTLIARLQLHYDEKGLIKSGNFIVEQFSYDINLKRHEKHLYIYSLDLIIKKGIIKRIGYYLTTNQYIYFGGKRLFSHSFYSIINYALNFNGKSHNF